MIESYLLVEDQEGRLLSKFFTMSTGGMAGFEAMFCINEARSVRPCKVSNERPNWQRHTKTT